AVGDGRRRGRGDRPLELDLVVVGGDAEPSRPPNHADRARVRLLRLQIRVAAGDLRDLRGLVPVDYVDARRDARGIELVDVRRTDIPRAGGPNQHRVGRLPRQAQLPGRL